MDVALLWELFHWAVLAALLAGVTCPLVGCFLLVRRTGFYGIALPQFASAGVLAGYAALPWWLAHVGLAGMDLPTALESPHALEVYLWTWAVAFTGGGLLVLAAGRSRDGMEPARVAAAFALASAAAILFAMAAPTGAERVEGLLHGEILVVGRHELEAVAVAYGAVLALLAVFHRDLLLVSYDADTARVLGKRVGAFELLLLGLIGLTVSVGVVIVGPVVLFGLLVLPPLAARGAARSMRGFYALSSLGGLAASALGVLVSFRLDWPLGPSVVLAGALLVPVGRIVGRARGR